MRAEYTNIVDRPASLMLRVRGKSDRHLSIVDLCHWNGHIRERALRTLSAAAPNAFFFAMAMRRLNDWVPQVRTAAREQLPRIASSSKPEHIVQAIIATIRYWGSWSRVTADEKSTQLEIINTDCVMRVLIDHILTMSSGPMTVLLSHLGRLDTVDKHLIDIATNAVQPSVRAKAYRSLMEQRFVTVEGRAWEWTDVRYCQGTMKPVVSERPLSVSAPLLETIKTASRDPSVAVRRVAAEILIREIESLDSISTTLAKAFAADPSSSVSERGEFALRMLNQAETD